MATSNSTLCDLTAEYVRSILYYDPATGILTWRHRSDVPASWNTRYAGKPAGSLLHIKNNTYVTIRIRGKLYLAHRLIWLYVTGAWPARGLDHEDGDGLHNRFPNLREATQSQNGGNRGAQSNNASGYKGVHWEQRTRKFVAQIQANRQYRFLGRFSSPEEAHAAYTASAKRLFGEYARAG